MPRLEDRTKPTERSPFDPERLAAPDRRRDPNRFEAPRKPPATRVLRLRDRVDLAERPTVWPDPPSRRPEPGSALRRLRLPAGDLGSTPRLLRPRERGRYHIEHHRVLLARHRGRHVYICAGREQPHHRLSLPVHRPDPDAPGNGRRVGQTPARNGYVPGLFPLRAQRDLRTDLKRRPTDRLGHHRLPHLRPLPLRRPGPRPRRRPAPDGAPVRAARRGQRRHRGGPRQPGRAGRERGRRPQAALIDRVHSLILARSVWRRPIRKLPQRALHHNPSLMSIVFESLVSDRGLALFTQLPRGLPPGSPSPCGVKSYGAGWRYGHERRAGCAWIKGRISLARW